MPEQLEACAWIILEHNGMWMCFRSVSDDDDVDDEIMFRRG